MNNSSEEAFNFNETEKIEKIANPAIYGLQIVPGLTMLCINGLCFVAILRHRLLSKRKAYVLMAALNLMELIWALGSILGGCDRLYLHYSNKMIIKSTRWRCFLKPQNIVRLTGICSYGFGHLSIAGDRFLAITWPQKHHKLGWGYTASMVVFSFTVDIYLLPYLIYQMSKFIDTDPSVLGYCSMRSLRTHEFPVWLASRKMNNGAMYLSVVLSLYIIVRLGCCGIGIVEDNGLSRIAKEQRKRQRRLAMSVALSSVILFGMTVLPGRNIKMALLSLGIKLTGLPDFTQTYIHVGLLLELGTVVDFFIFACRHIEMRMAIKYLFQNKRLTKRDIAEAKGKPTDAVQAVELVDIANQEPGNVHPKKQKINKETSTSSNEKPLYRQRIQRGQRTSEIVRVIEL